MVRAGRDRRVARRQEHVLADRPPRHHLSSIFMLVAVGLATLALIALCIYAAFDMVALRRGSAGPLMQGSPAKAPAPATMQPNAP